MPQYQFSKMSVVGNGPIFKTIVCFWRSKNKSEKVSFLIQDKNVETGALQCGSPMQNCQNYHSHIKTLQDISQNAV